MKTILIIDDERQVRDIYKKVFAASGRTIFRVIEAENAEQAIGHLIREKVDLVLLDIRMPQIEGRTIGKVIKKYDPDVRIVVASVFPVDQQKEIMPFAHDYYDKSEGPVKLLEKITASFV
jgi:YesN/AraC family two-component response regulator